MKNYIIEKSNNNEEELIIENLVRYNLTKVPKSQKEPFISINRVIKDDEGKIIAGCIAGSVYI